MLIELQQTDWHHSNHNIQPVCHSLQERGNEHDDKRRGYRNYGGSGFCGNEHSQCRQEQVADIAADQRQHPDLPHGDVVKGLPDPELDNASGTTKSEVAQCDEAVNQHGTPVQDGDQQQTGLDLDSGGLVSAHEGGEIDGIRFPFELIGENSRHQKAKCDAEQTEGKEGETA